MDRARDAAWAFAQELAPLRHLPQVARMAVRDSEAVLVADTVLCDGVIVRLVRDRESQDVAHNIRTLAAGEFRNTVPGVIATPAATA